MLNRVFCTIFLWKYVCVCLRVIFILFVSLMKDRFFCQYRMPQTIFSIICDIICCNIKEIRTYISNTLLGQLYYFSLESASESVSSATMTINHSAVRGLGTQSWGLFSSQSPFIPSVTSFNLLSYWPFICQRCPNLYP